MMVQGIAISEGIGIGSAHWINVLIDVEQPHNEKGESALEVFRFLVVQVENDIHQLIASKQGSVENKILAVFEAHSLMLKDPMFALQIEEKIGNGRSIKQAIVETAAELTELFMGLEDPYLRERASDIKDVSKRLLLKLSGGANAESKISADLDYILIAKELTPSDLLVLDPKHVKGILTVTGGPTAHVAIIARSLGIPAVSGVNEDTLLSIQEGVLLAVDAFQGQVYINPTPELITEYQTKIKQLAAKQAELEYLRFEKAFTKNGKRIEIAINIGNETEADDVIGLGTDGIGLFRTELFYANRQDWPTEEEQFEVYRSVLQKAKGNSVIVRTLDIGGDKGLPYLTMKPENNPFLGLRAIRLCLNKPEIFRTQLRALLKASVFGQLKIMFPMISGVQELMEAKQIFFDIKRDLIAEGFKIAGDLQIGIMVEIPSAALLADVLAKEVDFFSIGTNDLVQYTLAVDRSNDQVSYLYDYFHPAVLRLIKTVIDGAHYEGKWVGMCGEMAGDPLAIPLLIAMGIDELSMSSKRVLEAKRIVRNIDLTSTINWAGILQARTAEEVRNRLANIL